ncbi:unnamed protein product [Dicrocoelium dendriticum]|nr:unnamed protein product [Dicrocoelium dendriticum]
MATVYSNPKLKPRELALSKLSTQYEDLDMWIHNYLPNGDISETEKQHLRDVMLRDQAMKKNDTARIKCMAGNFPAKLRPEILSYAIEALRQQNPAVPGSGLVSLCAPVTLDRVSSLTPSSPSTPHTPSFKFHPDIRAGSGQRGSRELGSSPRQLGKDRCSFCYARLGPLQQKKICQQCQQTTCGRCIFHLRNNVLLCRDCLDIARVMAKTGDWFARYLSSKPANPLRMGVTADTSPSSRKREFRNKIDESPQSPRLSIVQNRLPVSSARRSPLGVRNSGPSPLKHQSAFELQSDRAKSYEHLNSPPVRYMHTSAPFASTRYRRQERSPLEQIPSHTDEEENQAAVDPGETKKSDRRQSKRHSKEIRFSNQQPSKLKESLDSDASYQTPVDIQGEVELSLEYDSHQGRLAVMLYGARNIAAVDRKTGTSSPMAKVYLQPDPAKGTERKINCKGHTCSPVFNQAVCYSVSPSELASHTVVVELWHKKSPWGKLFLGEVAVPLQNHKWDNTEKKRLALRDKHPITTTLSSPTYLGEVNVGLRFVLAEKYRKLAQLSEERTDFPGTLEVHANSASNLRSYSVGTNLTSFLKVSLIVEGKELETHSTYAMPKSNKPRWNTVLRFDDLDQSELLAIVLQISVWNQSYPTKPAEFLGGIRLGKKPANRPEEWQICSPDEYQLWTEFTAKSDQQVTATLPLHDL